MASNKTVIDLARDMVDNERVSTAKLEEIQNDLPTEEVEAWAEAVQQLAEARAEVDSYFDEWQAADGGDDKRDARESLLEALQSVVDAFDTIDGLGDLPEVNLGH